MKTKWIEKLTIKHTLEPIVSKNRMSGPVVSTDSTPKTVIVYDRGTGYIVNSCMADLDSNTWELYMPFRSDGTLTVLCRDEGGSFNADVYDKVGLCTTIYPGDIVHTEMIQSTPESFDITIIGKADKKSIVSIPYQTITEELKGSITKLTGASPVEFKNVSDLVIDDDNISSGVLINGDTLLDSNKFTSDIGRKKGLISDIFSDGSDEFTIPLFEDAKDISGNGHDIDIELNANGGKFGGSLYRAYTEFAALNYRYQGGNPYTVSFWYLVDYTYSSSEISMFEQPGMMKLIYHYLGQNLMFRAANTSTTWKSPQTATLAPNRKNQLHHYIFCFGDGVLKIYINGALILDSTHLAITPDLVNEPVVHIGTSTNPRAGFNMSMLRCFNRNVSDAEALLLYNEVLRDDLPVSSIVASEINDNTLSLTGFSKKAVVKMPFNNDFRDISGDVNFRALKDGVDLKYDCVGFDGTGRIQKAPDCSDTSGLFSLGGESSLDIVCSFIPTRINADEILWKSGDATNGIAVGIKSGNVGLFGASSGVLSSIGIAATNLVIDETNHLWCKNGEIVLFDKDWQVVTSNTGAVTSSNAIAQESVGGACEGSPMTSSSTGSLEEFVGTISEVNIHEGGTSLIKSDTDLKIAAEIGETGVQCGIEVEKWDPHSDDCIVWVTIPSLSSTVDNEIRFYYQRNHEDNLDYVTNTGVAPALPGGASQDWQDLRTAALADSVIEFTDIAGTSNLSSFNVIVPANTVNSDVYNFPLTIKLEDISGSTAFDCSDLFDSVTQSDWNRIFVTDIDGNILDTEVQDWSIKQSRLHKLDEYSETTIKSTSRYSTSFLAIYGFDLESSPIGSWTSNGWLSESAKNTDQKINFDCGSEKVLKALVVNNMHSSGSSSTAGIKNVLIYGTNSVTAFNNTTYTSTTDLTLLNTVEIDQHPASNEYSPQTVDISSNSTAFRYYVLRIADNWGSTSYMGFRSIVPMFESNSVILNVRVPVIYAATDNILIVNFLNTNPINTKIGLIGSSSGQSVWDDDFVGVWHLNQDVSYPILDSTGNQDGSYVGEIGRIIHNTKVGPSVYISERKEYFEIPHNSVFDFDSQATVEVNFVRSEPLLASETDYHTLVSKDAAFTNYSFHAGFSEIASGNTLRLTWFNRNTSNGLSSCDISTQDFEEVTYFAGVSAEGENLSIYLNTNLQVNGFYDSAATTFTYNTSTVRIGCGHYSSNDEVGLKGFISSVRISKVKRDYNWLLLTDIGLKGNLTVQQGSSIIPNALHTWELARNSLATIPASQVASDMINFPMPFLFSASSGTLNKDFSTWFDDMMKSTYFEGTQKALYQFGSSLNGLADFNINGIVYSQSRDAVENGAVEFDGTGDGVFEIDFDRTVFLKDFSVSVWIYTKHDRSFTTDYAILGTDDHPGEFLLHHKGDRLYVRWGGTYAFSDYVNSALKEGWSHIVITRKKISEYVIYVDGVQKGSGSSTAYYSNAISPEPFLIGSNAYIPGFFKGSIDDLLIFDKVLSPEEVEQLNKRGHSPIYTHKPITTLFSIDDNFHPLKEQSLDSIKIESDPKTQKPSISITFDKLTYKVFSGNSWRSIATKDDTIHGDTGNSNWFYKNDLDIWIESGDNENLAISQSQLFGVNVMIPESLLLIDQLDYSPQYSLATGICNIAVTFFSTDKIKSPELYKILYNEKEMWLSEEFDLSGYDTTITDSSINWIEKLRDDIDYTNYRKVYVMLNGDPSWTECVQGQSIPGITPGMSTIGRSMKFKVEWDVSNGYSVFSNSIALDIQIKES